MVQIVPDDDGYAVKVVHSPKGEAKNPWLPPFEQEEHEELLAGIAFLVNRSSEHRDVARPGDARIGLTPEEVGERLFNALFSGPVGSCYDRCLGALEDSSSQGLRIKLKFELSGPDAAQITNLPWELLRRPDTGEFLSLSRRSPVVRYLDVPQAVPTGPLPRPLRILVLVATSSNDPPLDLETERDNLESAWDGTDVEIVVERAELTAMRDQLLSGSFHVLHYMGHGTFDPESGIGALLFDDENGDPFEVNSQTLTNYVRDFREDLRLIFLNACDSASAWDHVGGIPYDGVATSLVRGGLPAVLAMQFPISDHAAITFSKTFYRRLAAGDPVDAATAEGRLAISSQSVEWGTPVLFMRVDDGRIFDESPDRLRFKPPSVRPRPKWNVPYDRNRYFIGRDEDIESIHETLSETGLAILTGLGGVGKTQTAIEYAYRYRKDYESVFWVRAATEADLISGYEDIAEVLGLERSAHNQRATINATKEWLKENPSWLLVLDNADEPNLIKGSYPTEPPGHILLTSRSRQFSFLGVRDVHRLDTWPLRQASEFMLQRTGQEKVSKVERKAAAKVAKTLGLLPLALEQASAFVVAKQVSFADYLKSFRTRRLKLLDPPEIGDSGKSVVTTWDINFQQVEGESKESAEVLRLSAFLAPDRIPLEILIEGSPELGPVLTPALANAGRDPVRSNEILAPLMKLSLIEFHSDDRSFSVHKLVQEVMRARMPDEIRQVWAERCIRVFHRVFPRVEIENWPLCERLEIHVRALSQEELTMSLGLKEAGRLFSLAGQYCHVRGRYREAAPLYEKALIIREDVLGPESLGVASSLDSLATLRRTEGEYSKAAPLYERALRIREDVLGPNHLDVASSLDKLAALRYSDGGYTEAEKMYERALRIREHILGPEHSDVAESLHGLANLYRDLGRLAQAERLHLRALETRRSLLGEEHPDVAASLDNLANLHRARGDYSQAAPLHVRALEIREKVFGRGHPYVAASLNNLANLRRAEGARAEAESLLLRALRILEVVLGPEHPDLAVSLTNLARLRRDQGAYEQAVSLYERALSIRRKALRPEHPQVAISLANLANVYRDRREYDRAVPLYREALRVQETVLGDDHPDVATSLNNLANVYSDQKEYDLAGPLYRRALQIREKALGPDHLDVARTLHNMAILCGDRRARDRAVPLFERALSIRENALGPDNSEVARTLYSLANIYIDQKAYGQAIPLYERVLRIWRKLLPPEHPHVTAVLRGYSFLLQKVGRSREAREIELQVEENRRKD